MTRQKQKKFEVVYTSHDENDGDVEAFGIVPQVNQLLNVAAERQMRWAHIILPVTLVPDSAFPGMTKVVAVLSRRIDNSGGMYGFTLCHVTYCGPEELVPARKALEREVKVHWCKQHRFEWQAPLELEQP
jgi:hypothetical protein